MIDYLFSNKTHTLEKNNVNMLVLIISLRHVNPLAKIIEIEILKFARPPFFLKNNDHYLEI